jgi:hypothetical protein
MVNKNTVIAIGILIICALGFLLFSEMTGNTITGSVVQNEESLEEYPSINVDNQANKQEGPNDTQNISG